MAQQHGERPLRTKLTAEVSQLRTRYTNDPPPSSSTGGGLNPETDHDLPQIRSRCSYGTGQAMLLAAYVVALATLRTAEAHGWLEVPPSRNYLANGHGNFWDPMSLNRWARA